MSNAANDITQHSQETPNQIADRVGRVWSNRYEAEGKIWGDEASPSALILEDLLDSPSLIAEFGYGYGRDMRELAQMGHKVTGIEKSEVGEQMAKELLGKYIEAGQAHFLHGDFSTAPLGKEEYDAVESHRVLHLLGNNGLVRAFKKQAEKILKPEGLLVVSARNENDFNDTKMKWLDKEAGVAEYKDRPGHIISFWTDKRFEDTFSDKFNIESLKATTEIESQQNPEDSHITIMVARKKLPANVVK